MKKCKLIEKQFSINEYKGESYMRAILTFEIVTFKIFKSIKKITYDVTMFEDYKAHLDNWDNMIENKSLISYKIIKDRIIF